MKEYDEATLKKVQQTELGILKDFIKVCDENNLTWFGDAGSGIGALRHKGFIPWDDDMDIMLTRDNYDKLIEIIKKDDKYDFLDMKNGGYFNFSDICYKNTIGIPFKKYAKMNSYTDLGVYIDIFPLDNLPEVGYKKHMEKILFYMRLLKTNSLKRYFASPSLTKAIIKSIVFLPLCIISKIYTKKRVIEKIDHLQKKFNNIKTDYIGIASFGYFERYRNSWFDEYIDIKFEGCKFMLVKEYDKVIRVCYDDYMTIPDEKDRKIHLTYYKWYKKV